MNTRIMFLAMFAMIALTVNAQSDHNFYLQKAQQRLDEGDCDGALRSYNVYKELSGSRNTAIEASINNCQRGTSTVQSQTRTVPKGYVDLGLPSGTLWKDKDENGYYSFDEAVERFDGSLPNEEQLRELLTYCNWEWSGWSIDNRYYRITGPNGLSIVMPAKGQFIKRMKDEGVYGEGQCGIWLSGIKDAQGMPFCLQAYREYRPDNRKMEKDLISVVGLFDSGFKVRLVF